MARCSVNLVTETGAESGKPIRCPPTDSSAVPAVHNVTVDLKGRLAKQIKLSIEFEGQWLLINEITFESGGCLIHFELT